MYRRSFCFLIVAFLGCSALFGQANPTTQQEMLNTEDDERFIQLKHDQRIYNNRNIVSIVRLIVDKDLKDSKFTESLGLTLSQLEEIRDIFDTYSVELEGAELIGDNISINKLKAIKSKLKTKLTQDINKVLLPHQLSHVSQMDVTKVGIPKLLVKSPVGDLLELTDGQKRRIELKSDALAKKIEKFIHESRQEAYGIVFDELSDDQKTKLSKLYNTKALKRQMSIVPVHLLFAHCAFDLPEDFDERMSPAVLIMSTKLEDGASKRLELNR